MRVRVEVPAVSGNLGSGFDTTGMALALYSEAEADTDGSGVHLEGVGAHELPRDERNLCVWSMRELARRVGRPLPPHGLTIHNRIPVGRGLASSGAAVISGLLLANALLGEPCGQEEITELGTEIEGHPDNVAAAMLGGVVVSAWDRERVRAVRLEPPPGLEEELVAVVWVPEAELETRRARAVLPEVVPLRDAVYNLGRAALFSAVIVAMLRCAGRSQSEITCPANSGTL